MTDACGAGDKTITSRTARLARDADGDPLGCAMFLDPDDLRALVDDLDSADRVAFTVENGRLVLDVDGDGGSA